MQDQKGKKVSMDIMVSQEPKERLVCQDHKGPEDFLAPLVLMEFQVKWVHQARHQWSMVSW